MNLKVAPDSFDNISGFSVFLAGSIELGTAQKWQDIVIDRLKDESVTILNPRRESWDHTWEQKITDSKFNEQVTWELEALERADLIVMYFDKNSKSPITLLELGLYARSNKMIVCCPDGFWRKGNVDIVCERYGVKQVQSIEELVYQTKLKLIRKKMAY